MGKPRINLLWTLLVTAIFVFLALSSAQSEDTIITPELTLLLEDLHYPNGDDYPMIGVLQQEAGIWTLSGYDHKWTENESDIELLSLLNEYRSERGLQTIEQIPIARLQALLHNARMLAKKMPFDHSGLKERIEAISEQYDISGFNEVLAQGCGYSAKCAIMAWTRDSDPIHKSIVENPRWNAAGVSIFGPYASVIFLEVQ